MGKELQVAALENGTAIDHIPTRELFKVVALLQLQKLDNRITIGNNLKSSKMGAKGIIKVSTNSSGRRDKPHCTGCPQRQPELSGITK